MVNLKGYRHGQYFIIYVLLKALPPVCMKCAAQGEGRVANIYIAGGEARVLYLSQDSH